MSKGRSQPLGKFFFISVLSAAAAFFGHRRAAAILAPWLKGHEFIPAAMAAYTLVFAGAFVLLSFFSHRISLKFSLKAQGLEKTQGAAPKFARAVLAVLIFAAPVVLMHAGVQKERVSLENLIAASDRKAASGPEQGYKKDDRTQLGKLMGGKI